MTFIVGGCTTLRDQASFLVILRKKPPYMKILHVEMTVMSITNVMFVQTLEMGKKILTSFYNFFFKSWW